jgi:hypothetical protein
MKGFPVWAKRHCTIFGLLDARQIEMVAAWQEIFDTCGWTADELHAATTWLAAHDPPRFSSDHLPAVQRWLRDNRRATTAQMQTQSLREQWQRERQEAEANGGLAEVAAILKAGRPAAEPPGGSL